ncbi:hypothetical protein BAUCODRAFT_138247 [Baudoinia panamericana UAMH 10762]|uniref:Uncharacterized protein n=1 Tax=Baudoinia panamericana (strain UAMH 10762) TaxID=717646 RepID=M2NHL3_BAUPA|nr:uncharacterized protein BAUCODRAFT_138247 [Baudoinia panamericana UAMH 10762]EMC98510.1 hypothetical protein BAUCODRAFT_138247 [Baudoinia panamericana UAMH 10762]
MQACTAGLTRAHCYLLSLCMRISSLLRDHLVCVLGDHTLLNSLQRILHLHLPSHLQPPHIMARAAAVRRRALLSLIALPAALRIVSAQTVYYFSGAVSVISQQTGSPAVPAVCPAGYPIQCNNINPNYCCPSNNVCSNNNNYVACCPNGVQCSGAIGGANGYAPLSTTQYYTTYVQPTTVYTQPQATTVYGAGVVTVQQATTVYPAVTTPQTTTQIYYGQYCATYTEVGVNVPTTARGDCGTVLIVAPSEGARSAVSWLGMGVFVVLLHMFGALVLPRRLL